MVRLKNYNHTDTLDIEINNNLNYVMTGDFFLEKKIPF